MQKTIAALATPPGEGGIAIIRVSGPEAVSVVSKVYTNKKGIKLNQIQDRTLVLGWITDSNGQEIDQVLVSVMRGPHSYTGEDVVEVNCHGGRLVARRILEVILEAGASPAEPGEFTKRAFLNGRLDMAQAEAVLEIIRSRSERALRLSIRNLQGAFSRWLAEVEEDLVYCNSRIEAALDFPEEVGDPDWDEIKGRLNRVKRAMELVLDNNRRTKVFRDGLQVAIVGRPNVGKSTLLNALLGKERAIVTDIPGTTRDVVEDWLNIKGIPVRLLDTAGMREAQDVVEKMGIERARKAVEEADLVIMLVDAAEGFVEEDREIYRLIENKRKIVLVNKSDLDEKGIEAKTLAGELGAKVIEISARFGFGLEELEEEIASFVEKEGSVTAGEEIMVNVRQEHLLNSILVHVEDALRGIEEGNPLDCLAVDTWGAVSVLEELNGKRIREDIIDKIFADFCIGK